MSVTAFQDLPLADRDREWDGDAAEKRVRDWAGLTSAPAVELPCIGTISSRPQRPHQA